MDNSVFAQFLAKFKEGKSEQEVAEAMAALFQFHTEAVEEMILSVLTEEDLQALDQITDEAELQDEIVRRFTARAGFSPQDFVLKLRDAISTEYLKKNS